jgi:C1A family cysteine protease
MIRKISAAVLLLASLASVGSAQAGVTFEQPGDFQAMVSEAKSRGSSMEDPKLSGETFTKSEEDIVYTTGLKRKGSFNAVYKSFKNSKEFIPNTYDLRPSLTQIENQGSCGSCWAFSLTATHRDGHALSGRDPGRLSQEWMVQHSPESAGCQGGYFDSANDFVSPKGQPLWEACPYKNGAGKCAADLPIAASITKWYMLGEKDSSPTTKDIQAYMVTFGKPVSIDVAAGAGSWMSYKSGIYNACKSGQVDHMINIVGWDNEGAAFDKNGNLPPGKGVWILRNSWGTSWGENGYMRSRMTDAKGKRCNAVAEDAAAFEFAQP